MLHALAYILIAASYVATLFGLDKPIAVAIHAAIYALIGLADFAKHTKIGRVSRLIGILSLIGAFQVVEVDNMASGETRPPIVYRALVPPKGGRVR